ncbi:MAG: demethoxyubiquinone hydroxylase family protein [Parvularculaceae bacterium]|jgi:ubiquinone biosynthesis monooxygenase Coq7|nr:demethoxyubiquinone hydroxylase family protein [Parvularculaceae bacterium]
MTMAFEPARERPGARRSRLEEMLRVDHAGEYGAVRIYQGQRAVFDALPSKSEMSETLRRMEEGEAAHLKTFDALLADRTVRPTALAPLWNIAGYALGAATALMGEKAAMAATEAVEGVIERHYADQASELQEVEPALAETIASFRNDELAHKKSAEDAGAHEAFAYPLLRAAIAAGCRLAIRLSEKL